MSEQQTDEFDLDISLRIEALQMAVQAAVPTLHEDGVTGIAEPAKVTLERAKLFEAYLKDGKTNVTADRQSRKARDARPKAAPQPEPPTA
jgi:hypothetical protein